MNDEKYTVDTNIKNLMRILGESYLVGGYVRDTVLGRTPHDIDLATILTPDEVMKRLEGTEYQVIPTGIKFGTVTVLSDLLPPDGVQVTTFRSESGYSDYRHPDNVVFGTDIVADLSRRDFTINAMAMRADGSIIDPFDGMGDIYKGLIKTVGHPDHRFQEDPLRMLRAIRFTATLENFFLTATTTQSIMRNAGLIIQISKDRCRDEIIKILLAPDFNNVRSAFLDLEMTGLLAHLFSPLAHGAKFHQNNPHHRFTVLEHNIWCCAKIEPVLHLRLAALLHDSAKHFCYTCDENGIGHFPMHDKESARLAEWFTKQFRFSNEIVENVTYLVANHMFDLTPTHSDTVYRRFIIKHGYETALNLLRLRKADMEAHGTKENISEYISSIRQRLDSVYAAMDVFGTKNLNINGHHVMDILGIESGPEVGRILDEIVDLVVDGTLSNNRQELLGYLQEKKGIEY